MASNHHQPAAHSGRGRRVLDYAYLGFFALHLAIMFGTCGHRVALNLQISHSYSLISPFFLSLANAAYVRILGINNKLPHTLLLSILSEKENRDPCDCAMSLRMRLLS